MKYDRKMLEEWSKMPDWGDYLIQNGGLNKYSSKEGFQFLQKEYYEYLDNRIRYCKNLLRHHKDDAFLCYVLAELYDRCNEDESPDYLYKRPVKYYCRKALEIDPNFTLPKKLLQKTQEWLEFIGGDKGENIVPDFDVGFGNRENTKEIT